jgi:hypothetical protein
LHIADNSRIKTVIVEGVVAAFPTTACSTATTAAIATKRTSIAERSKRSSYSGSAKRTFVAGNMSQSLCKTKDELEDLQQATQKIPQQSPLSAIEC